MEYGMHLTYKHPFNQSKVELELSEQALSSLDVLEKRNASDTQIAYYIERMNLSAEMKLVFDKLAIFTMNVGKKIIQFGKKIIELVIMFATKHKRLTITLLLGLIIGALIVFCPPIASTLSSFQGPIMAALGVGEFVLANYEGEYPEAINDIRESMNMFSLFKYVL